MADQAGMMAVNRAVEALADDPAPPGAFVRGAYRRLRVGPYRVLYEVEGDLITMVRIDRDDCDLALPIRPVAQRCGTAQVPSGPHTSPLWAISSEPSPGTLANFGTCGRVRHASSSACRNTSAGWPPETP